MKQTVLTPNSILDPIRELWDGEIAMDPCDAPDGSNTKALARVWQQTDELFMYKGCQPFLTSHPGGLSVSWPSRTFVNPPYNKLKDWLHPPLGYVPDTVWLVPVRPHRTWWRSWARDMDLIVYLNPLKFEGYAQTSAPLCLGYFGHRAGELGSLFSSMGGVI